MFVSFNIFRFTNFLLHLILYVFTQSLDVTQHDRKIQFGSFVIGNSYGKSDRTEITKEKMCNKKTT